MKYAFFMVGLMATAAPAYAEINTLEDALAHAYEHDAGLKAAQAKLRATDEQISQALSGYRPSIEASGDIGRADQSITSGVRTGSGAFTQHDTGVSVTQPVFRGLRTEAGVKAAKASIMAERAALAGTEQQLMIDTSKAYLDVLQSQSIVDINRQNETDLKQELSITNGRFRIGELTKTDVDQAQSRLQAALTARVQAEGDLANNRQIFARLAGEMPGTLTPPKLSLEQTASKEDAMTQAEEYSPNVVHAKYAHKAAQADVISAEGNLEPEVSLVGSANKTQDQNPSIPQPSSTLSLMVKATIPLYRSGSDYSKTREAKQTVTQRSMEIEDAKRKAREDAARAWQTMTTGQTMIAGDKDAMDATDRALFGVRKQAKVGTRTTLDVLNAEQELLNARVNLAHAEHDRDAGLLQVRQATGMLTAQALHLPVELYDVTANYKKARRSWIGTDIDN